jgi:hypothetical protein
MGMTWLEIVILYYVAFCVGGVAYDALVPLRRKYIVAAMLSGVLFVMPAYLGFAVLIGVGLGNKGVPLDVVLTLGATTAFVVGIPVGLRDWGKPVNGAGGSDRDRQGP